MSGERPSSGATADIEGLRHRLTGEIVLPGDGGWDAARQAWNLSVDQRPVAVVFPETAEDVAAVVDVARAHGLQVAAQGTGHSAGPLGPLAGTISTRKPTRPACRRARCGARSCPRRPGTG